MTVLQFDHYWNIQNNLIDSQEADEIDAEKIFIFLQVKHMYSDWVGFFSLSRYMQYVVQFMFGSLIASIWCGIHKHCIV